MQVQAALRAWLAATLAAPIAARLIFFALTNQNLKGGDPAVGLIIAFWSFVVTGFGLLVVAFPLAALTAKIVSKSEGLIALVCFLSGFGLAAFVWLQEGSVVDFATAFALHILIAAALFSAVYFYSCKKAIND
jgi:hypothetical protein